MSKLTDLSNKLAEKYASFLDTQEQTDRLEQNIKGLNARTDRLASLEAARKSVKHYVHDFFAVKAALAAIDKLIAEEKANPQPVGKIDSF